MFIKEGTYSQSLSNDNPVLKCPKGKSYEVSYVTVYVWDQMDGKTTIDSIVEEIVKKEELNQVEVANIVKDIASQLAKLGLLRPVESEMRS